MQESDQENVLTLHALHLKLALLEQRVEMQLKEAAKLEARMQKLLWICVSVAVSGVAQWLLKGIPS